MNCFIKLFIKLLMSLTSSFVIVVSYKVHEFSSLEFFLCGSDGPTHPQDLVISLNLLVVPELNAYLQKRIRATEIKMFNFFNSDFSLRTLNCFFFPTVAVILFCTF